MIEPLLPTYSLSLIPLICPAFPATPLSFTSNRYTPTYFHSIPPYAIYYFLLFPHSSLHFSSSSAMSSSLICLLFVPILFCSFIFFPLPDIPSPSLIVTPSSNYGLTSIPLQFFFSFCTLIFTTYPSPFLLPTHFFPSFIVTFPASLHYKSTFSFFHISLFTHISSPSSPKRQVVCLWISSFLLKRYSFLHLSPLFYNSTFSSFHLSTSLLCVPLPLPVKDNLHSACYPSNHLVINPNHSLITHLSTKLKPTR